MNEKILFEIISPTIIFGILFFLIAEFFGRSKHIGRWWTFFMMFAFLPGIIALILSPSAKGNPVRGNKTYLFFGVVLLLLTTVLFFTKIGNYEITDFFGNVGLFATGLYLIDFSKGEIINRNPKFYFDNINSKKNNFSDPNKFFTNVPKDANFYDSTLYYIIENDFKSEPLTYNQLKIKNITENTYIWRDGLVDWTLASNLEELKTFFRKEPPPFNKSNNINTKVPPPFTN